MTSSLYWGIKNSSHNPVILSYNRVAINFSCEALNMYMIFAHGIFAGGLGRIAKYVRAAWSRCFARVEPISCLNNNRESPLCGDFIRYISRILDIIYWHYIQWSVLLAAASLNNRPIPGIKGQVKCRRPNLRPSYASTFTSNHKCVVNILIIN